MQEINNKTYVLLWQKFIFIVVVHGRLHVSVYLIMSGALNDSPHQIKW